MENQSERPTLRVVRGHPDADELAAVTAVIAATNATDPGAAKPETTRVWAAPARSMRQPIRAGVGAWASSALR